jgi:predicted nucleic acid-binding protein
VAIETRRFGLDSNVLVYLVDGRDPVRQARARLVVERAGLTGRCVLSVQNLGEAYVVSVRKRLAAPAEARLVVDDLATLFPLASPTGADVRAATAAASSGRFSYWVALLLATLGRAGCAVVLSEDMHDGASLAGVVVRNPFAGDRLPAGVEELLA